MKTGLFHESTETTAPGYGSKTVVPSDTDPIYVGEYARELVVFSAGAVCFVGADGATDTWTFTSGMGYPQRINIAVTKVKATGTTVIAGDIKAIR
ncbi:spike base protein, RCAP_Rcc01079 family [Gemmata sp.]|uniref:spike base protein, RCAP_Rcc01079 family n=1 Tax=Gemmata sp. TaxID=1914242 RepID=UPI003F6EA016